MSNVKHVDIAGEVPFCFGDNSAMCQFLGQINSPACGISIQYTGPMRQGYESEKGSSTAFYNFRLYGDEAVSTEWIQGFVNALVKSGATLTELKVVDIETNERIRIIPPPPPKLERVLRPIDGPGNVTTTAREIFTHADHCRMAAMIFKRFGRQPELAALKWRKMLENDCPVDAFMLLAEAGLALTP